MISHQLLLAVLFGLILLLLAWGRVRHDLVAAAGLLVAVALGLVPADHAFSGFDNEAVIVVALALILSRALENSGVLAPFARIVAARDRPLWMHIALISVVGGLLSTVMNNVAALALLMPLDIEAARRAKRAPGPTLMPLSFATILGGIVTLIGTPSNIVVSSIRAETLGAPYRMFDFTPVGFAVALVGVAFVAAVGWRLVPRRGDALRRYAKESAFHAELAVPEGSPMLGKRGAEVAEQAAAADVTFIGLRRGDRSYYRRAAAMTVGEDDHLIVEGSTAAIGEFMKGARLNEDVPAEDGGGKSATKAAKSGAASEENGEEDTAPTPREIFEGVVRVGSRLDGATARSIGLQTRFGFRLLGIARRGEFRGERVADRSIEAGDTLLLTPESGTRGDMLDFLGLIVVNRVDAGAFRPVQAAIVVGLFLAAVLLAGFGIFPFSITLAAAVAVFAALGIVPAREFYTQIEWPIVVMLACLLPVGAALDRTGATQTIAHAIVGIDPGGAPIVSLVALMLTTLILSGVLNNIATVVIFAPVAIDVARGLHANPDTFLMGVAIAAACGFLSPVSHKNNMLIMGPGGFRFGDFWQLGVPLSVIVLAVSIPMLLLVWPL